jgi:hypothetical protein
MVDTAFMEFACMYARGQPVTVDEALMPSSPPRSEGQMAYMEDLYKVREGWLLCLAGGKGAGGREGKGGWV